MKKQEKLQQLEKTLTGLHDILGDLLDCIRLYGKTPPSTPKNIKNAPTVQEKEKKIIPLCRWNDYHEWPSISALRWYRFQDKNGFNKCLISIGRKLYIDEQLFFDWLSEQKEK